MRGRGLVVVSGASSGIGAACVGALREQGFRVIGVDRIARSDADEHLVVDLSDPSCGAQVAAAVEERPLAGLVNNAARAIYHSADETTVTEWDEVLNVNLRAAFLLVQALSEQLRAGKGSVVNVASVHAEATSVGVAAYAAAKGGLVSLTRALALELAPEVRVNSVLPGAIDTPMLAEGLFRTEATIESLGRRHPLGRVGEPKEVAEAVLFLLDRGSFITGANLRVDGGALARLSTE